MFGVSEVEVNLGFRLRQACPGLLGPEVYSSLDILTYTGLLWGPKVMLSLWVGAHYLAKSALSLRVLQ